MVRQAGGTQYRPTTYSTKSISDAFTTVLAAARWSPNRPLLFRVHFRRNRTGTRTGRLRGRSGEAPESTPGGREFTHRERTARYGVPSAGEKAGMSAVPVRRPEPPTRSRESARRASTAHEPSAVRTNRRRLRFPTRRKWTRGEANTWDGSARNPNPSPAGHRPTCPDSATGGRTGDRAHDRRPLFAGRSQTERRPGSGGRWAGSRPAAAARRASAARACGAPSWPRMPGKALMSTISGSPGPSSRSTP